MTAMMKTIPMFYLLSEQGRRAALIQGLPGTRVQRVEALPTQRVLGLARVPEDGLAKVHVGYTARHNSEEPIWQEDSVVRWEIKNEEGSQYGSPPALVETRGCQEFDTPQTPEALLDWEDARRDRLAQERESLAPALAAAVARYEANQAASQAIREQDARDRQAREEAAAQKRAEEVRARAEEVRARAADRRAWIDQHGSSLLGKMVRAELPEEMIHDRYTDERLAVERPGWKFGSTSCAVPLSEPPTEAALDALLEARQNHPGVDLKWCPGERRLVLISELLGHDIFRYVSDSLSDD